MDIADASADIVVTDHAALRWLERYYGLDVGYDHGSALERRTALSTVCAGLGITPSALKDRMLSPKVRDAIRAGARRILVDGTWFCIDRGVIRTVLGTEMARKAHAPKMGRAKRYRQRQVAARREA